MVAERTKAQSIERSDFRFTRREVREHTGLGNTQLKVHLRRLEELEYLLVHAGGGARAWSTSSSTRATRGPARRCCRA